MAAIGLEREDWLSSVKLQRLGHLALNYPFGFQIELSRLKPPTGFLPTWKQILGKIRKQFCFGRCNGKTRLSQRQNRQERISHGFVFRPVNTIYMAG
jgi:hypothetical protein